MFASSGTRAPALFALSALWTAGCHLVFPIDRSVANADAADRGSSTEGIARDGPHIPPVDWTGDRSPREAGRDARADGGKAVLCDETIKVEVVGTSPPVWTQTVPAGAWLFVFVAIVGTAQVADVQYGSSNLFLVRADPAGASSIGVRTEIWAAAAPLPGTGLVQVSLSGPYTGVGAGGLPCTGFAWPTISACGGTYTGVTNIGCGVGTASGDLVLDAYATKATQTKSLGGAQVFFWNPTGTAESRVSRRVSGATPALVSVTAPGPTEITMSVIALRPL